MRIIPSMKKVFLNVAASLLLVALVILAQSPDGAAQGPPLPAVPAGPDSVATNLVTTACAGCHTLDRIRNKVADSAAWLATVTRMKERGAALTDEQVAQVVDYLTRAAANLPVPAAGGGGRGGAGGRGGGGRGGRVAPFSAGGAAVVSAANLKVLTEQNVEITMQNITFALGVRCIDCHDVT